MNRFLLALLAFVVLSASPAFPSTTAVIPWEGAVKLLDLQTGKAAIEDITVKLFTSNTAPQRYQTASDYTVMTGQGYVDKTITAVTWSSAVVKGSTLWVGTTAKSSGDIVRPTNANDNGHYYQCTTAGTTAGSEPTWPTGSGSTVNDGSVVWTEQGNNGAKATYPQLSWVFTAGGPTTIYGVLYIGATSGVLYKVERWNTGITVEFANDEIRLNPILELR
ncbi:MAG: hypothetical protein HQK86_03255 [Nitrospinae bacterium]|nr:hypothetical protein [Nitrospinota bacterium]